MAPKSIFIDTFTVPFSDLVKYDNVDRIIGPNIYRAIIEQLPDEFIYTEIENSLYG